MNRRTDFINNVLTILFTVGALIAVVAVGNARYSMNMGLTLVYFIVSAVVCGFICTLFHEIGHLIAGKRNGFAFLSVTVWFFRWKKENGRTVFDFVMIGDEAGYTEMAAKSTENLETRLKKMTQGGLFSTLIPTLCGIIPLFIKEMPVIPFFLTAMLLPMGVYAFFGNALPMSSSGSGNDGKLLYGLKRGEDDVKVALSMLAVQSELFNGKTPAEIDESYYFDLPQLPEDDYNFLILLSARHDYYLDKGDYVNLKKVTERMLSLEEYIPKNAFTLVKVNALFDYCFAFKDEDRADELMADCEKYLNKRNGILEIRAKLAYMIYVREEKEHAEIFYKKAVKECNACNLLGQGIFERKLVEKIKEDFVK